jgi:hypothetical protein
MWEVPMTEQLSFIQEDGSILRDRGMSQSLEHAEQVEEDWGAKAMSFLLKYAKARATTFMAEDVRRAAQYEIEAPPSLRSWGGIFCHAARSGWIRQVGYKKVQNPTAHCANAAVWESCL